MNRIRMATKEEIEGIKDNSDLDASCVVLALDTMHGTALAVVRRPVEVDPVHFPEGCSDKMKMMFIRDIETVLSVQGATRYYFNLPSKDEDQPYRDVMEHMSAIRISKEPEYRYRKDL